MEKPTINGNLIRTLREERGWTQDYLAKKAKIARSTVAMAESGRSVSLTTRRKIAEQLGIPAKTLLVEHARRGSNAA